MDARLITRLTNAGLLVGVGVGGGHWLMPARPGSAVAARVVFIASMACTCPSQLSIKP